MKISVDRSKCHGHAQCWLIDSDLFPIDDEGYTLLRGEVEVAAESEAAAHEGVANCPERAISYA